MPVVMTVDDGALKAIKTFNRRPVRNRIVATAHYHSMKGLLLKFTPFSLTFQLKIRYGRQKTNKKRQNKSKIPKLDTSSISRT
jgi:hypothetical protein